MQQEGVDPSFLDKGEEVIPLKEAPVEAASENKVKVSEHPIYSKYFKMLKVQIL